MEKELIELFDSAKKAADAAAVGGGGAESSPEEDRCLDALKVLKKFPVNYQILVSTQVRLVFYMNYDYILGLGFLQIVNGDDVNHMNESIYMKS